MNPFIIILQKQQFLAENPKNCSDGAGVGSDDDDGTNKNKIDNMSAKNLTTSGSSKEDEGKKSQGQKKRGRPRKDGENTKAGATEQVTPKSLKTVTGVRNRSQYQLRSYKQQ